MPSPKHSSAVFTLLFLGTLVALVAFPGVAAQPDNTTVVIDGNATVIDNTVCASADWRVSLTACSDLQPDSSC